MDQEKINQFREEQAKLKKEQAKAQLSIDNAKIIKNSVDNSTVQNKANADKIASAVNSGANATAEEVKKSSSNILSALENNSSSISDALNNLVVATVMSRDPELVNVVSNFTELLSSLNNASDKLGKSPLNEIPAVNKQLTKALQDFIKLESSKDEPDYTKAFDSLQKAIEKLDIKPVINVPKQEMKIDLKPVENLLKEVKDAVSANEITIPETNLDGVILGLQAVQDTIANLRFPVPNFMLPFTNSVGKDTQMQLNADGSLPVTVVSGGGGGSGDGAILDGVSSSIRANVKSLGTAITTSDNGLVTNAAIHGLSSSGGGTYVDVKVNPSGSLQTAVSDITGVVGQNTMANSLPVAIASNQSAVPVSGDIAAGSTDSGNPVKVGAKYNATLPTLTDGQRGDLQLDTRGALRTILSTTNSTTSIGSRVDNADAVASSATADNLKVSSRNSVYNGTTWDRMPGDTTGVKIQDGGNSITVDGTVTSNIGTTNGLALDATLTGGTQTTKVTDGTNTVGVIKSDGTSAAGNAISAGYTGYTTSFSVTAVSATTAIDMTNYSSVSVHITSQGTTSTVTPQWSNDNTNWVGGSFTQINGSTSSAATSTTSSGMVFYTAKHGRYFRLNITGITAGTTAGNIHVSTSPIMYQTVGGSVGNTPVTGSNTGSITTSSTSITSTSSSGHSQAYVTISGTYSGVSFGITVSADGGTTYASVPFVDLTNGRYYKAGATVSPTDNSTNVYMVPISPLTNVVRVLASAWTSGTGAIRINYGAPNHTSTFQQPQVVTHTALPTAATTPNSTPSLGDKFGRQVVIPGTVRDLVGTQTTTISASTTETTIVTAAASTFNDLTAITVANTSTTPTRVDFRNTTAGSVIFSLYIPGSDVRGITFQRPVPQASVNTNWTATSSASVTDLRVFAVFDKNA